MKRRTDAFRLLRSLACAAGVLGLWPGGAGAAAPPTGEELVLGMSTVLSGPAAELGQGVKLGVEAALDEVNRAGGIHDRPLRLIALDDGYEPSRTGPNMHRLIETDSVLAILGNVGTPTAVVAIPIAMDTKTPFVGAFTGAGVLRKSPPDRYVINFRASYGQETAAMVDALVAHAGVKPEEVAFFTQKDAYGDAGYMGGMAALRRHGLKDDARVAHGRYERNTTSVEGGAAEVLSAQPPAKAVIMVGAYAPTAEFVKLVRSMGERPIFMSVSFVGTEELGRALGDAGDGVIVTQVVPPPDSDVPIAAAHRAALAAFKPEARATYLSLEGYAAARMLLSGIERIKGAITREAVVDALENLGEFDIGLGERLVLSGKRHQACERVWPTVLRSGRAEAMAWEELSRVSPRATGSAER
ncbi:MAG: ABC transporter substrate-binding protein [Phycisphaerales bacterium]